jgi:pantetheine-phosphate adenylyltransferase
VCPGSYDPVTVGHLDIIDRAATIFDEVVVAVLHNPGKPGYLPVPERVGLLQDVLAGRPEVRVVEFGGRLLVDVCREVGADVVVKGLRGGGDYGYELPMALMNRHLSGVETVFVPGDSALQHVSSSLVRQISAYGGDVRTLVPAAVQEALARRSTAGPDGPPGPPDPRIR